MLVYRKTEIKITIKTTFTFSEENKSGLSLCKTDGHNARVDGYYTLNRS